MIIHHIPNNPNAFTKGHGLKWDRNHKNTSSHGSLSGAAPPGTSLLFGAQSPTGKGQWQQEYFREVKQTLHDLVKFVNRFWEVLTDKLIEGIEYVWEKFKKTIQPVTVSQLHGLMRPLLKASSTGFPLPIIRAGLIQKGSNLSDLPYSELAKHYEGISTDKLLSDLVQSESMAYLTTHVVALEHAIKSNGNLLRSPTTVRAIHNALLDTDVVLGHRTHQLYGDDTVLVDDRLYQLILNSPKTVLHEHARGCAPIPMVRRHFIDQDHPKANKSYEVLQEYCRVDRLYTPDGKIPLYTRSLNKYREKYDLISKSIQTLDQAYMGAYIYALKSGLENVRYFEYRFNPMSAKDINTDDPMAKAMIYAKTVQQGLEDAKAFLWEARKQPLEFNMIFTAYRHNHHGGLDPEEARAKRVAEAMQVLDAAIAARQQGIKVTGFDIAGDEMNYAITDYKPVADKLKAYNRRVYQAYQQGLVKQDMRIGATIHAGETAFSGLISHPNAPLRGEESILKTIELFWDGDLQGQPVDGAQLFELFKQRRINRNDDITTITPLRIGHGIRVIHNPVLAMFCKFMGIGFEQCPKSNVQTGAVEFYPDLPTVGLSRFGLPVNVSCDNRTPSKTNTCNELVKLTRYNGAHHDDRKRFQLDGLKMAFIFDEQKKQDLITQMLQDYQALESQGHMREVLSMENTENGFKQLIGNGAH